MWSSAGECVRSILFLYINDFKNFFLYADDAAIIVSHKGKENAEAKLSREIERVSNWFIDNRLS